MVATTGLIAWIQTLGCNLKSVNSAFQNELRLLLKFGKSSFRKTLRNVEGFYWKPVEMIRQSEPDHHLIQVFYPSNFALFTIKRRRFKRRRHLQSIQMLTLKFDSSTIVQRFSKPLRVSSFSTKPYCALRRSACIIGLQRSAKVADDHPDDFRMFERSTKF